MLWAELSELTHTRPTPTPLGRLGFNPKGPYPARVRIDPSAKNKTSDIRLNAGLAVTADIRTGQRRIISYLVSPIDTAISEAGREK